ncbi:MAG: alpha-L-arabinofuranosidase C-terminal domain-containing protein [Bacteroides xylanisolvens]
MKQVELIRMCSGKGTDENSMENKECVKPVKKGTFPVSDGKLKLTVPAFSLDIIKINKI